MTGGPSSPRVLQHGDGAVSPEGLMEKWRTSHPGRAWLSALSADSCLSSDPAAFVPVFRARGRAHHPLVQIIPVPAAPSQRESIPAVPSQTGGAHPASPGAILNLSASCSHGDCSMMEKLLLPLSSLLGLSKNSPEHLKMCSDLLTGGVDEVTRLPRDRWREC